MKKFEFRVYDADGLWGDLRMKAASEATARTKCRAYLRETEIYPDGLLEEPFRLIALKPTKAKRGR